ncbi:MAG: LysM peptidoglycan-binding domain-containing protein [Oscillospiraceae bacterium]|nr:LysM peptidoglycan-binding domain-containing protein [Oscillospiraceae bacterium]
MELQFEKDLMSCLQMQQAKVQSQEQTQELRLPEGMPDIGTVLACWGQILLRGKEWRSDAAGISGGVMAWVLYLPEEGGAPQSVEAWLPFQMKWNVEPGQYDGTLLAVPLLRSADARCLSARKLMVRTNVSVMAKILQPSEVELYRPGEVPEDVQLLKRSYPVCVPTEAGEKAFVLEENIPFPTGDKVLFCSFKPEVTEKKLMSDKVIFRGMGILHLLCRGENGELWSKDVDVPFSQYAELDRVYEEGATVDLLPLVTNLELESGEEGNLQLKAGISGQYVIYDRPVLETVEDAYSPARSVQTQTDRLALPVVLDSTAETVRGEAEAEIDAQKIVDLAFWPEHPYMMMEDGGAEAELSGIFQMLYYDPEGQLQSAQTRWEDTWNLPADQNSAVSAVVQCSGRPQAGQDGAGVRLRGDLLLESQSVAQEGIPMVTGLELGELQPLDPNRPTLILRKAGDDSLWEIAKASGSTVAAIQQANGLQQPPQSEQMLLIPVQ